MATTRTAKQQQKLNERLFNAAEKGDVPAIKQALLDGAIINARDSFRYTSLHYTAHHGHTDAMKVLLEAGAKVDVRDGEQNTPLHWAAHNGYDNLTKVLLAVGADLTLKDKDNKTPIDQARKKGQRTLVDYLQYIVDNPENRPTPQEVGFDINKRNTALKALGKPITKPIIGEHTAKVLTGMEAQRQAALNDPSEGI